MTSQFADINSLLNFFDVDVFPLSSLVTGPSFGKNPEIRNTPFEFCPISEDWDKLGIPNLTLMSLKKFAEYCKLTGLQPLPFLSY